MRNAVTSWQTGDGLATLRLPIAAVLTGPERGTGATDTGIFCLPATMTVEGQSQKWRRPSRCCAKAVNPVRTTPTGRPYMATTVPAHTSARQPKPHSTEVHPSALSLVSATVIHGVTGLDRGGLGHRPGGRRLRCLAGQREPPVRTRPARPPAALTPRDGAPLARATGDASGKAASPGNPKNFWLCADQKSEETSSNRRSNRIPRNLNNHR